MTDRWIAATDLGLARAGAFLLRLESVELRDARHAWRVHPEHSLHVFAPGYLGVAGIPGLLHFLPLPQPWGLLTYLLVSSFFGMAVLHMVMALLGRSLEKAFPSSSLDAVASVLGMLAVLSSLVLLSFLAPSPLNLLYR